MDVDKLKEGRELDALIHEHVMKRPTMGKEGWSHTLGAQKMYVEDPSGNRYPAELFRPAKYSTDIRAAWDIIELLNKAFVIVIRAGSAGYTVQIDEVFTDAATAPLAICRAALKPIKEKL